MKISKSFKITTFIFIGFLFVNNPFAYSELPNNLIIHDIPKKVTNIIFKDVRNDEINISVALPVIIYSNADLPSS